MQPLPIDTESFWKIRTSNPQKLYVDKTAYLHRLITDPQSSNYFLARPRRFGKSLMISTLEEIFLGHRELFRGLAIDGTDYDWQAYPVIHLDMGRCASADFEDFLRSLPVEMERALATAGYVYEKELLPSDNFGRAIDSLAAEHGSCVVLVDEYDDPVAKALKDPAVADKVRDKLATVYGQLKSRTAQVRFLMLTGVSKFTKLSVFSTISNLVDLADRDEYASLLGYTEAEIDANFAEHVARHASKMGLDVTAYRAELRRLFNGYRFWREEGENVYNPVSVNLNLGCPTKTFNLYWTKTGRPSMLMNFMERGDLISLDPECVQNVLESEFDVTDLAHLKAMPMLYQTGYLTIRDYNRHAGTYTLGVPDEEVRRDFSLLMASQIAREDVGWAASLGAKLLGCDWDGFFLGLKSLYGAAAYGSTEGRVHESSYSRNLLFLLRGQGIVCQPEVVQADGRADLVADHVCGTYVFELKVDKPAALATTQAERKHYATPYLAAGKPVWIIGLSFDSRTHELVDHCVEEWKEPSS